VNDQLTFEVMAWTAKYRIEADEASILGRNFFNFTWHLTAYRYIRGIPLLGVQGSKVPWHIPETTGEFLAILHETSVKVELDDSWGDVDDDNWTRRKFKASLLAYP
jgi:hypothetical protein